MENTNGAKRDKHTLDLLSFLSSGMTKTKIPTSEGPKTVSNIMSELSYSCYAHNRDLGMTHEQLIRIGLGNDDMNNRYTSELEEVSESGKKWELPSVKCVITKNLMVYPKIDFHLPITLSKEGTHIGDLDFRFWENLSTADKDIVYTLTHPITQE